MQEKRDSDGKALLLAGEILRSTTTALLLHLRFLESALFRLRPEAARTTFATNGETLYYGFSFLFETYRHDPVRLTRGYLHTLMHCIFRHPFVSGSVDRAMWDLACDVAVEAAIEELHLHSFDESRSQRIRPFLAGLAEEGVHLTAEKLYRHFITHPHRRAEYEEMSAVFAFCDHSCWYTPTPEENPLQGGEEEQADAGAQNLPDGDGSGTEGPSSQEENEGGPGDIPSENELSADDPSRTEKPVRTEESGGNPQDSAAQMPSRLCRPRNAHGSALDEKWTDVSRRIQMDLETFSREAGAGAGSLLQNLRSLNRERYDYRSFLLRFAQPREVMKVSEEEFDYIFYTYGLRLYGNVPLIEPLEYREDRRIRDFAVVIDTSGSTSGELVQTFLQKTYNILKTTDTFDSRMRLRLIQADADIQESVLINSQEELEACIRNFRIRGGGGTDFRPAFAHVDDLIRSGELARLRGLIYFTDGYGTYPAKQPAYDSAFVFVRDTDADPAPPHVPPWAIRLILDRDEVAAI